MVMTETLGNIYGVSNKISITYSSNWSDNDIAFSVHNKLKKKKKKDLFTNVLQGQVKVHEWIKKFISKHHLVFINK